MSIPTNETVVHHLSDLPSRCPDPELRADKRMDPYWAPLWNVGSTAVWLSRTNAERMVAAGVATPNALELSRTVEEATLQLAHGTHRNARLAALAALAMWRTATDQQVASIIGSPNIALRTSVDRDVLWGSGLVQRGQFMSGMPRARLPRLLRVSNTNNIDLLASMLSYRDLIGVTSGQPWRWGSQHDRHNLLATELALRVAEFTNVAGVFGEQLGFAALLHPEGGAKLSGRAADTVMVRGDGMRIAVEMTASATDNMVSKIARWVDVLTSDKSRGLAVMFVEMPHPDRDEVNRELERQIVKATDTTSSALANVQGRMMVARWQEWFPGYHQASDSFLSLSAHRPTGRRSGKDRLDSVWEPVSLLDPFDLVFEHPRDDSLAILENQNLLYGIPYWLRTGAGPVSELDRAVLADAGLVAEPKASTYRLRRAAKR